MPNAAFTTTFMMMPACLFCKIASGAEPAHVVHEDEHALAFLDRRPLLHGHVLLVPRGHYETLVDVPRDEIGPLFQVAQTLCRAVQQAMNSQGMFVAMNNRVSQSVPHLHIHIVPRRKGDGLKGFFWPRTRYAGDAEMNAVAEAIRAALRGDADDHNS